MPVCQLYQTQRLPGEDYAIQKRHFHLSGKTSLSVYQ